MFLHYYKNKNKNFIVLITGFKIGPHTFSYNHKKKTESLLFSKLSFLGDNCIIMKQAIYFIYINAALFQVQQHYC